MVSEAERYKEDDKKQKERIESKNQLENYAYSIRSSLSDENLSGKLNSDERSKLQSAVDAALGWLDTHQSASKEEFDAKQKELEGTAMPIMAKLAQEAGGEPSTPKSSQGPKVDDVD